MIKLEDLFKEGRYIILDGYNEAIVGVTIDKTRLIYSSSKIIEMLVRDGMDEDQAFEFFEYNIYGSKIKNGPLFLMD
jgi:hypothetical protein